MHGSKRKTEKGGKNERSTLAMDEKPQAFVFADMNGFLQGHKSSVNTSPPVHALFLYPGGFVYSEDFSFRGDSGPQSNWCLKSCLQTELVNEQS